MHLVSTRGVRCRIAALALALATILPSVPASAENWSLRIASWNLLNLGLRKAGLNPVANRNNLLDKYANTIAQYDIVVLQEILDTGTPVTVAIANRPQLANYNCQTLSVLSGRRGRQERYSICYATHGGRLVLNGTADYMAGGGPYAAFNGTNQPAQNVWMRPPLYASFTYTPPPGRGAPFTFGIFTNHTKPSFGAQPRPAGIPVAAPQNTSVYYELWGIEHNLRNPVARYLTIGDLNADCASYPAAYRNPKQNFAAPYSWYVDDGEKTNTAPLSSCAYDRIILNPTINLVYLDHGIFNQGIAAPRLDGERVSDHFLVWVEIGRQEKHALIASTAVAVPVPLAKRQRRMTDTVSGGSPININATGISIPNSADTPMVYVLKYDKSNFFAGNRSIPLVDVRGAATPVTVRGDGTFSANVIWNTPAQGNYTLVLDVDGDGVYNKSSGDIVNANNEIDFIVDGGTSHSQVTTLDDNGRSREVFNENSALHVYGLAKNLTSGAQVDVYVVATKLLPAGFVDWATARSQGTLDLAGVAVPVNRAHGPLLIPSLTKADKVATATVGPDGSLFLSAWPSPYKLFNMRALAATPPVPDYKPEYDVDDVEDPCEDAATSTDQNFQAVCNVGNIFTDTYGTRFNVVIDVNRNGRFDDGDLVDTHDIGDIGTYFGAPSQSVLDARANGNPAVGEYKEYLNAKLSLDPPLTTDNTYDQRTAEASVKYLCAGALTRSAFQSIVQPGSQIGFKVLNQEDYGTLRAAGSGLYNFIDAKYDRIEVPANAQVCMSGDQLELGSGSVGTNATVAVQASNSITIHGELRADTGGAYCFLAAEGLVLSAGTGILTYFTGGAAAPLLVAEVGVTVESARQCFS